MSRHALALADPDSGEVVEFCREAAEAEILRLRDHVCELQRVIAGQASTIGELKRDKQKAAEAHKLWPLAIKWHAYHVKATGRRSRWKLDHFERAEPFLRCYGLEVCMAASDGIALDHFSVKRANGTIRHYNTWDTLLKNTDRFEEAINSCPLGVLAKLREEGLLPGSTKKPAKGPSDQQLLIEEAS